MFDCGCACLWMCAVWCCGCGGVSVAWGLVGGERAECQCGGMRTVSVAPVRIDLMAVACGLSMNTFCPPGCISPPFVFDVVRRCVS